MIINQKIRINFYERKINFIYLVYIFSEEIFSSGIIKCDIFV